MTPDAFTPAAPGRLIPARAGQRRIRPDGQPELVYVEGFAFAPDPLPPQVNRAAFLSRVSLAMVEAEAALARLAPMLAALPHSGILQRQIRADEARLSSAIEATVASLEEIALAEAAEAPSREEIREVWNNLRALEHGLDSPLPLSSRLFCEMHAILLSGVRGEERNAGRFRDRQVYIGDARRGFAHARFVPPPPAEPLQKCMAELERYLNPSADAERFPISVEMAFAHYQFECIHPFSDGNGRLGRLLITLMPCKQKSAQRPALFMSGYLERRRREYYDLLLAVSTRGEWAAWVEFFCRGVVEQCASTESRARALSALREQMLASVNPRAHVQARLVDLLFSKPAITPRLAAEELGSPVQVIQRAIDRLVAAGFLDEITGKTYRRIYVARRLLRVVEVDHPETL